MRTFGALWHTSTVPIIDLLQRLDQAAWGYLFSQLLVRLAHIMESTIIKGPADSMLPTVRVEAGDRSKKRRVKRLRLLAGALLKKQRSQLKLRICQYFFAGRRHFSQVGTCSMCVDASRIGKRQCMVAAIARPDNIMMWAPPQACG